MKDKLHVMKIHAFPNGYVVKADDGATEMFKSLDEALDFVKHGNHDQSVHGRKGSGFSSPSATAAPAVSASNGKYPNMPTSGGKKVRGKFDNISHLGEVSNNKVVVHVTHDENANFRRGVGPAARKTIGAHIASTGGGNWSEQKPDWGHTTNPDGSVVSTLTYTKD